MSVSNRHLQTFHTMSCVKLTGDKTVYDAVFRLAVNGSQMAKHRLTPAAGLLPSQRLIHNDVA